MKIIIVSSRLLSFFTRGLKKRLSLPKDSPGPAAIMKFPFIIVRNLQAAMYDPLLNHELIHLRQYSELWYFGARWFLRYDAYRLRKMGFSGYDLYMNLAFEREAWKNMDDLEYLSNRPKKAYKKYIVWKKVKDK